MSQKENQNKEANRLINTSSPYLLQHAYNPVNWYPWSDEAFKKAREEDKPILLSIGYSSCHWCHVMERESFENDDIAQVMNDHFISVKVDREERPDVDQIYMDAVQSMGMGGGWPLNIFLTPDLKPFYGGTYFQPQQWQQVLMRIANVYQTKRDEVVESAEQLYKALAASEIHKYNLQLSKGKIDKEVLDQAYQKLSDKFDRSLGGTDKAPKFPMPAIWIFLLRYFNFSKNTDVLDQVKLTLDKMALGGIYDQIGGGFARYSTDSKWLVPHFEKMLYDNGQLVSLYSEAYNLTGDRLYKHTVYQTAEWLEREMMHENGGFFSALDADSEGEEGKFYLFTKDEIEQMLPTDLSALAIDYYNITGNGNWEDGKNILHADHSPETYAENNDSDTDDVIKKLDRINSILLEERNKRVAPGLDNKIIAAWNCLMNIGITDAYRAFGDVKFLDLAERNIKFINDNMRFDGVLQRIYNVDGSRLDAYLEDHAAYIHALIKLYEVTFNEKYLDIAKEQMEYVITHFYDHNEQMFFYNSAASEQLIARKKEIFDNVIPSSNSMMGINLYFLSLYYDEPKYRSMAENMLRRVSDLIPNEPVYLSNWANLYYYISIPTAEIVIVGDAYKQYQKDLFTYYHPNKIIMGDKKEGKLPLMKSRSAIDGETTIYVCFDKTCKLPVHKVEEAAEQMTSS
ncbi:MAG: thioredoxin domain-containing protein [Candidatus Cyclobacteriaceae bacterium M2_1C_046]